MVGEYHGDPSRVKEAFSASDPRELNETPGFLGAWSLVDSKSGEALTMTLWETEEAMLR